MRGVLSLLVGALLATQAAAAPAAPAAPAPTPAPAPAPAPSPPTEIGTAISAASPPAAPPVASPTANIPKAPEIPAAWKNEGAGVFKKEDAKPEDYAFQNKAIRAVAELRKNSMPNSAHHLDHYLKIKGTKLPVNVDKMLTDLPMLKNLANYDSVYRGQTTLGTIDAEKGSKTFTVPWMDVTPENPDWLYAMGTFKYSMTGLVTKTGHDAAKLEYKVHIFRKYNWDEGGIKLPKDPKKDDKKHPDIAKEQKKLALLHLHGLAQEYIITGFSCVLKIDDLSNARLPPKPPGREKDAPLPPKKGKPEFQEKGCKITADALRHRPCPNTGNKCPAFGQQSKGVRIKLECYVEGQKIKGDKTTKYVLPLTCSPLFSSFLLQFAILTRFPHSTVNGARTTSVTRRTTTGLWHTWTSRAGVSCAHPHSFGDWTLTSSSTEHMKPCGKK
jgi:hypothetical protein